MSDLLTYPKTPFDPATIEELTGYTVRDVVAMYEDYENMAKKIVEIEDVGEYTRGWRQGRKDTMQAYGIKEDEK